MQETRRSSVLNVRRGFSGVFSGLLVAAATLFLGVIVLELSFGTWLSSNPWERALALNILVNRTLTFDAGSLYDDGGLVAYTRDSHGLRGQYERPELITILTLGGSTTDQRYISDGQTWQDELQRQLRAAGRPATVANAGVDGHTTYGQIASHAYWFRLIPRLKPAYTILYIGINDFVQLEPAVPWEGQADGRASHEVPTIVSRNRSESGVVRMFAKVVTPGRSTASHPPRRST
jgi:hypothetical protein